MDQMYESEKIKKGKEAMDKRINYHNSKNNTIDIGSRRNSISGKKKGCKC